MERAGELIENIVRTSRIPSARRRRELARELRAHIDDFADHARREGLSEAEIERLIVARFGDPREMGRNFAWVYRADRAAFRAAAFALCTPIVAALIAAGTLGVQAAIAAGFGQSLNERHSIIELLDILATVAAYNGLLALEELFATRGPLKAAAALTTIATVAAGLCTAMNVRPAFVFFGLANALFLRGVRAAIGAPGFRFAAVSAGFAIFALMLTQIEHLPHVAASMLVSWTAMGAGYQLMTGLAERISRVLLHRIEQH